MAASTSADRVRTGLDDAHFPAGKDELVDVATRNGADDDTIRALRAIPPEQYANIAEVLASVTHDDTEDQPPVNPIVEELGENRYS